MLFTLCLASVAALQHPGSSRPVRDLFKKLCGDGAHPRPCSPVWHLFLRGAAKTFLSFPVELPFNVSNPLRKLAASSTDSEDRHAASCVHPEAFEGEVAASQMLAELRRLQLSGAEKPCLECEARDEWREE